MALKSGNKIKYRFKNLVNGYLFFEIRDHLKQAYHEKVDY